MDNSESNNDRIFIPYGIKIEKEIFSGFGKKEVKHLLMSILVTAVLAAALYFLTANPFITVVVAFVGIGGGYNASIRKAYSQSMIEIVKSIIVYHRTQQSFEYVYHSGLMKDFTEENMTSSPGNKNDIGGENGNSGNNDNSSSGTDN